MKNLLKLGTALTRAEQKMVNGGLVYLKDSDDCPANLCQKHSDCNMPERPNCVYYGCGNNETYRACNL